MKRSEIVELITELVCNLPNIDTSAVAENIGEVVLSRLEEAGAAPPEVKIPCETHYLDAMGKVVRGEDSFVFVRKWEDG